MRSVYRWTPHARTVWVAALSLLFACSLTEEPTAPMEVPLIPGNPCASKGTLVPGDTASGFLRASSCAINSDYHPHVATRADRWLLTINPDTAYLVTAHLLSQGLVGAWHGSLVTYEINHNDTLTRSQQLGSTKDVNGDVFAETFVADTLPRQIMVQIEGNSIADSGAYRLVVTRCPITRLIWGFSTGQVQLSQGCHVRVPIPGVTHFFYHKYGNGPIKVKVTRTAGQTPLYHQWETGLARLDFPSWPHTAVAAGGSGGFISSFEIYPTPAPGLTRWRLSSYGAAAGSVTLRLLTSF